MLNIEEIIEEITKEPEEHSEECSKDYHPFIQAVKDLTLLSDYPWNL